MLSHVFGQEPHADAGEVVDREQGVAIVVFWEQSFEARFQDIVI